MIRISVYVKDVISIDETSAASPLNLGLLCFIPYRAMESRVMDALVAAGFDDITTAQSRIFQRVGRNGTRLTELAESAHVTKQTAAFLVDALDRAGYVRRVPDPSDGRARLVCVAERGAAAIAAARRVEAQVEAEWTAHLGRRDADRLRQILTRLQQITDPYGEAPG